MFSSLGFIRCTDTSDLRHFGPKTFQHYVFGAEVSHIFALLPKCPLHQCRSVSVSSALKCMRHFVPRIKIGLCFECVKTVDPLYIRYSDGMEMLGKRLTKVVSDYSLTCEQSCIVGNEHNRSGSRVMQLQ